MAVDHGRNTVKIREIRRRHNDPLDSCTVAISRKEVTKRN